MKITTIGGGASSFNVLYGLKTLKSPIKRELSAIITMTDSGGTTGEIRDKYGVLPPGDIRRGIAALAKDTGMVRKLFEYKFEDEEGCIGGNKLGNTLLTALGDIQGSFEGGLDAACQMFQVQGNVIPVTLEDVHLGVIFEDGTKIIGEKDIDVSDKNPGERKHNIDQNISEAFLVGGEGNLNPRAKEAILDADVILICPGDLYTSVIPNLLSKGMSEALAQSQATVIYACNIMTKRGETTTYELTDFISEIEKYAGNVLDYVLVNSGHISDELVEKYKRIEGKKPVKRKEGMDFQGKTFKLIEVDLINESDVVRHDPQKLASAVMKITSHNS